MTEHVLLDLSKAMTITVSPAMMTENNALERAQEAIDFCDWNTALAAANEGLLSDAFKAHRFRAVALSHLGRHDEAIEAVMAADSINHNHEIVSTSAMVLYHAGRYDDAILDWEAALFMKNDYAEAAVNLGCAYLQRGEYERAWDLYTARFAMDNAQTATLGSETADASVPVWDGQGRAGKTLLIWGEQGLGEQVMWASMLRDVHARSLGMTIIMIAERRLMPLLARSFPWLVVVAPMSTVLPPHDAQIMLSDVGRLVRKSASQFPAKFAPWLKASQQAVKLFRGRYLPLANHRPIIGLSWSSDRKDDGAEKSIAPLFARRLIEGHDALWVNMQYGAKRIGQALAVHTDTDTDASTDIDILAAQLTALDLLITVSNTTAHIAAALGVKTWLLEPRGKGSRWYWGTPEHPSPWYPNVRVFHQSVPGRWDDVIAAVLNALHSPLDDMSQRAHASQVNHGA